MSYNTETTFANIEFMGREFRAEIEYEVTDPGSKAIIDYNHGGDPGWGPEWDIEEITLCEYRKKPIVTGKRGFCIVAHHDLHS